MPKIVLPGWAERWSGGEDTAGSSPLAHAHFPLLFRSQFRELSACVVGQQPVLQLCYLPLSPSEQLDGWDCRVCSVHSEDLQQIYMNGSIFLLKQMV